MKKDTSSQLKPFEQSFHVTESIAIGLLTHKTLAYAIRQATIMPTKAYHDNILDKLYPLVSRDEMAFIQSLHKINQYANTLDQEEPSKQITAALESFARMANQIDELVAADDTFEQEVMLSSSPSKRWQQAISSAPKNVDDHPHEPVDPNENFSFLELMAAFTLFRYHREPASTHPSAESSVEPPEHQSGSTNHF